ncbi:MAG TPA: hypothetical protein VMW17_03280 [Candidatus Binatia bacterium]|nr:hypothetical protein [Candidatus Binatia bacterium]
MEWTYVRRPIGLVALLVVCTLRSNAARGEEQTVEQLRRELETLKRQMQTMQETIRKQEQAIEQMEKQPTVAAAAAPTPIPNQAELEQRVTEKVMEKVQPSLSAANKTFASQFNPAIGLIIDSVGSYKDNERGNFEFRSAELGLSASVDPFARGYAIINGTSDGVEVEEAAIVTTSLPYNLTVKGGRFFADFGRLSKFHDHDLPFVNRPVALDRFIGGESQADGVEGSWLAPTSQYLTLTLGAYNKLGADNQRADNNTPRDLSKFTYLARPATFFSLNDANSIDLGATYAYTPKVDTFTIDGVEQLRDGKSRHLAGVDLTYRYTPLSQAQYRGLLWGTEFLYNREDPNVGDDATPIFRRRDAFSMYSYVEAKLTRRFYPGFLFDFAQDVDRIQGDTKGYSPYLTVWLSEFNRLRLQYTYNDEPQNHENQFFVQWTAVLGSHVHGFRDR